MKLNDYKDYRLKQVPFAEKMGIRVDYLKKKEAQLSMKVQDWQLNQMNIAHGGAMMTLADTSMGFSVVYNGKNCPTLDVNYRFLKPAKPGKIVVAKSRVIKEGRTIVVSEVNLESEGVLLGHATGTFFLTDKELPGFRDFFPEGFEED